MLSIVASVRPYELTTRPDGPASRRKPGEEVALERVRAHRQQPQGRQRAARPLELAGQRLGDRGHQLDAVDPLVAQEAASAAGSSRASRGHETSVPPVVNARTQSPVNTSKPKPAACRCRMPGASA